MEEDAAKSKDQPKRDSLSTKKGKQVSTQAPNEDEKKTVKLRFSHVGMDTSLGSLDGLSAKSSTQGSHYIFGSKVDKNTVLKDITNKATSRPNKTKYSKPSTKLNGMKQPRENDGPNGLLGPLFKVPQFSFNFETTGQVGGPNHSKPPDPMTCSKPEGPSASLIPIDPLESEGMQTDLGTQEVRAKEENEAMMEDHARDSCDETVPATPHSSTCG